MICKTTGCNAQTVGKSKYCRPHRDTARLKWQAMIGDKAAERDKRVEAHEALYAQAVAAGQAAAESVVPTPMLVVEREHPLGDILGLSDEDNPVKQAWRVNSGVCGFAWTEVHPGNCSFALWAVKAGKARKAYQGGVQFSARPQVAGSMVQSLEINEAYAQAFAGVLKDAGLRAYATSRMD